MDSFSRRSQPETPLTNRREFMDSLVPAASGVCLASLVPAGFLAPVLPGTTATADSLDSLLKSAPVARYWISPSDSPPTCAGCHESEAQIFRTDHVHEGHLVRCRLCSRQCEIPDGERGMCRARINVSGRLKSLVYGRPISFHIDPIRRRSGRMAVLISMN